MLSIPITNVDASQNSYVDATTTPGDTYYYVVTFEYQDPSTGTVYPVAAPVANVAPYSNEAHATACCPGDSAFWVDSGPTVQEMAQWLMGPGVSESNAKYTGAATAKGIFGGGNSVGLNGNQFPIDHGLIMASGDITNSIGLNNKSEAGTVFQLPNGDPDLNNLIGSGGTADAAVLEFDFVSTASFQLQIQYVYASEEYPEWAGSVFIDPFAIFISEGNKDGQCALADDIALVPGTDLPITINNMNGGYYDPEVGIVSPPVNPEYYVDNHDPNFLAVSPYAASSPVYDLQCDGFTVLLTAQASYFS